MIPLFLTEQTERQGAPFLAVFARSGDFEIAPSRIFLDAPL
jgi:hypothetical protein